MGVVGCNFTQLVLTLCEHTVTTTRRSYKMETCFTLLVNIWHWLPCLGLVVSYWKDERLQNTTVRSFICHSLSLYGDHRICWTLSQANRGVKKGITHHSFSLSHPKAKLRVSDRPKHAWFWTMRGKLENMGKTHADTCKVNTERDFEPGNLCFQLLKHPEVRPDHLLWIT